MRSPVPTKAKPPFVVFVLDQLEGLGTLTSRAMFGGHGVYVDGTIVGLIVNDSLYLKVDDQNRAPFERMGSQPFTYSHAQKGEVAMSYWEVPGDVLEDADQLKIWSRGSMEASLRGKTKKAPPKKRAPAKKVDG